VILNFYRIQPPGNLNNGRTFKILGKQFQVNGGGHKDYPNIAFPCVACN